MLVQQRVRAARAQQCKLAPGDANHLLDQVHAPRMAQISAPPRVTSVDVARHAGVSQSTVSLVLSGKGRGRISARTDEAVRAAAAELGYRPNVAARTLRTGVARTVGLVVPDITNPFFGRMMRGAQRAAQAGRLHGRARRRRRQPRLGGRVACARCCPATPTGCCCSRCRCRRARRSAAIAIESLPGELPVVRLDVAAGIDAAVTHLLELGHTRIGHLASAFVAPTFDQRAARLAARLAQAGLEPAPRVESLFSFEEARAAALPLLETGVTAVLCDDDILAGGLYMAARERGLSIPGDVSVIGFDDLDFARVLAPPLTTIAADAEGLGAAAFQALASDLAGEPPPATRCCRCGSTGCGESTAPPRCDLAVAASRVATRT